ncbi:hypothetical protein AB0D66_12675 [Streptomyces sp. NPDC048270]|uniref:hypothetical protein n=1 Tax=Streptomyces sp. NPDC048270 TaxID=3154615 RepID=UPI0033E111BE
MRTTMTRSGRAAAAALGTLLLAGCGSGTQPGAPAAPPSAPATFSSPSPSPSGAFGRENVRADLDAAVAAAGFPEGTKTGAPTPDASADPPTTDEERAQEQLMARIATCGPAWSSSDPPAARGEDPADGHRQFRAVLAGLAERGWKETRPAAQIPLGDIGSMLTAEYKKQKWTLYAHSTESGLLRMATIIATEDACTSQFTDEELELLND